MRYRFQLPKILLLPKPINITEYIKTLQNPIYLNDCVSLADLSKSVIDIISTDKADKSLICSCECGYFTGNYYKDVICPYCRTRVKETENVKIDVVLQIPLGIYVMHPQMYLILTSSPLKSYVPYLFDPMFDHDRIAKEIGHLVNKRGFLYTPDEFIKLIHDIASVKYRNIPDSINKMLSVFIKYKHLLFTDKLLVCSAIHTIESRANIRIVDKQIRNLLKSIFDMLSIRFKPKFSSKRTYSTIYKSYNTFITYIKNLIVSRLQKKPAMLKGSISGSVSFFTLRAVINPITEPHEGDEIHVSYKGLVELFRLHLISKLVHDYKFRTKDAVNYLYQHRTHVDPLLLECLNKLIEESPFKGIPVLLDRNPSLKFHSVTLVYITKIITADVIKMSNIIMPPMNADIDGDALQFVLLHENDPDIMRSYKYHHQKYSLIGYDNPEVNFRLPKNLMLQLMMWYSS